MLEYLTDLICLRCGHTNPATVCVCGVCAGELGRVCAHCGEANPTTFKYCGHCGSNLQLLPSALSSRPAGAGERRDVAVLFAEIGELSGAVRYLDAEDLYSIAGDCFSLLTDRVQRYEGTVDKFTGDGIMALFGTPVAHADDAERAVRCALEMQTALSELKQKVGGQHRIELKARIGINMGVVIVGPVGTPDKAGTSNYTVIGDSVNLAARLQQAAQPGQILVGCSIHRQTKSLIVYRSISLLSLKGLPVPVPAYQAVGLRQQPGYVAGVRRLRAPTIGHAGSLADVKVRGAVS